MISRRPALQKWLSMHVQNLRLLLGMLSSHCLYSTQLPVTCCCDKLQGNTEICSLSCFPQANWLWPGFVAFRHMLRVLFTCARCTPYATSCTQRICVTKKGWSKRICCQHSKVVCNTARNAATWGTSSFRSVSCPWTAHIWLLILLFGAGMCPCKESSFLLLKQDISMCTAILIMLLSLQRNDIQQAPNHHGAKDVCYCKHHLLACMQGLLLRGLACADQFG